VTARDKLLAELRALPVIERAALIGIDLHEDVQVQHTMVECMDLHDGRRTMGYGPPQNIRCYSTDWLDDDGQPA